MKKFIPLVMLLLVLVMLTGCKQDMGQREFGNANAAKKILVAGDTSEFKEKLLQKTIEKIGSQNYSIKVIGLDELKKEDTAKYGAVVLVNTCWAGQLDGRVNEFLKTDPANKKVIVFTSVGGESWKPGLRVGWTRLPPLRSPTVLNKSLMS